jgi:hypothetical protein
VCPIPLKRRAGFNCKISSTFVAKWSGMVRHWEVRYRAAELHRWLETPSTYSTLQVRSSILKASQLKQEAVLLKRPRQEAEAAYRYHCTRLVLHEAPLHHWGPVTTMLSYMLERDIPTGIPARRYDRGLKACRDGAGPRDLENAMVQVSSGDTPGGGSRVGRGGFFFTPPPSLADHLTKVAVGCWHLNIWWRGSKL